MAAKKTYELDLFKVVLPAIDAGKLEFYDGLTDTEKKAYTPRVIMRYMSSLSDQNNKQMQAVLMVNDLVNLGFWELTNYPDLQHRLLCACGIKGKQYRPWLSAKQGGGKKTQSLVDQLFFELYPWINSDELNLIKMQYTATTILTLALDAGKTQQEATAISKEFKADDR